MTNASTEPPGPRSYRDELNFAEFPLASLSDRLPPGKKTLVFEDTITDRGRGQPVTRRLTISASEKFGLPTALDDEVILGLVQLSSAAKFGSRKVEFTRYQLIKTLGWRDESRSYQRVADSLKRWLGVTLYYDSAWWSKEEQAWVSEHFHILDNVTILDQQRYRRQMKRAPEDSSAGLSSFTWNEVVFGSFQSGYLKQIDMDLYRSLKSRIAKRLFRFLDKRFHRRATLDFDLRCFAFEHIGLSKNYNVGQVKRKLRPAFSELERVGFLSPMDDTERFVKKGRGLWRITLRRASGQKRTKVPAPDTATVSLLQERNISQSVALRLAREFSAEAISQQLEAFDWLVSRKDGRVSKNPPGYLYKAITESYERPQDFERPRSARSAKPARPMPLRPTEKSDRNALDGFWAKLCELEQAEFERAALQAASTFQRQQYRESETNGGRLFEAMKRNIIDDHIRRQLGSAPKKYSDLAIETALTVRLVFNLPLRQAEGYLRSLLELMDIDLEAPDHTTLSRRSKNLRVGLRLAQSKKGVHLIVDSTGLSIVGEGEWAAVKHGNRGKRGWRKLHLGVDRSGQIIAKVLTTSLVDDASTGLKILNGVRGKPSRVVGDAAYDTIAIYNVASRRGAKVVVPPTRNASVLGREPRSAIRDRTIRRVDKVGRRRWKKESGYHRQGTAENAFYRYKSIIGDRLRARDSKTQETEALIACSVLNRMFEIGQSRFRGERSLVGNSAPIMICASTPRFEPDAHGFREGQGKPGGFPSRFLRLLGGLSDQDERRVTAKEVASILSSLACPPK